MDTFASTTTMDDAADSMGSWYRDTGCIDPSSLMPWFLVFIGIVIKGLMAWLMILKGLYNWVQSEEKERQKRIEMQQKNNEPQQNPETDAKDDSHDTEKETDVENDSQDEPKKSSNCISRFTHSKWYKYITVCYGIYQGIAVLVTFILDIITIAEQSGSPFASWANFQCLIAVLLFSSNTQTTILGIWALRTRPKWDDAGKYVYNVVIICMFALYLPVFLIYGFPGYIVYIWVALIPLIIINCYMRCVGRWCNGSLVFISFSRQVLSPILLVCIYIVLGLTMINFYSGQPYIDSFTNVMVERTWSSYLESSTETKAWRVIASLF